MQTEVYKKYVTGRAKKSPLLRDCAKAFLIGGTICTVGELFRQFYIALDMDTDIAGTLTSCTLVFLTALLTGLGIFDNISKHGGGGCLVPITGFANAVTSAAIDNKSEGFIMGVGSQMFRIAGPVIVYGITSGVIYGIIYYFISVF